MAVSIVACPRCHTLVLNDTAQCPKCRHVMNTDRLEGDKKQLAPGSERISEEPCKQCGEMVRVGLVRCWSCGAFMKDEIALEYNRMQAEPRPVIYSELSQEDLETLEPLADDGTAEEFAASDGDFELGPHMAGASRENTYSLADAESVESSGPATPPAAEVAESPQNEEPTEEAPKPERTPPKGDAAAEAHSVATAGDVLVQTALQEEAEAEKRRKYKGRRRPSTGDDEKGGFIVYCPNGCRIRVFDRHRGKAGKCPKCGSFFFVPEAPPAFQADQLQGVEQETADAPAADTAGKFTRWMTEVRVHPVNPERLKLKVGSLLNETWYYDLFFAEDGLTAFTYMKRKGGSNKPLVKKRQQSRETLLASLKEQTPEADLPVEGSMHFPADQLLDIKVVQPAPYAHESMFHGVDVFGAGRIAVRLPQTDDAPDLHCISFGLSQFREFAGILADTFKIAGLGTDVGVPLQDSFQELTCHYSDDVLHALDDVGYYLADDAFETKLIGRRCEGCGLVVSENSRKKEKIGGVNGKQIAKAKCPKCGKKFGTTSLYTIDRPEPAQTEESEESTAGAAT